MAIIKRFKIKSFKEDNKVIELKNISKSFNKRQVLDNISIKANHGEILGVLGPNGAGKSTILKIFMGIYEPDFEVFLLIAMMLLICLYTKELLKKEYHTFHKMVGQYMILQWKRI